MKTSAHNPFRRYVAMTALLLLVPLRGGAVEQPVIADSATFIRASLMVAEPSRQHVQSAFGHAFLRMECPSAGLDYCFSMESGDYEGFLDICIGNYPNRLTVVPTPTYLQTFAAEGRTVTERAVDLTLEEGQRLWQLLDETAARGRSPYHDYFHHGCSQEIVRLIDRSLSGRITFGPSARCFDGTLFTLGNRLLPADSWLHLPPSMLSTTDGTDRRLTDMEKTAFPLILHDLFADATIVTGDSIRPFFKAEAPVVHRPQHPQPAPSTALPISFWFWLLLAVVVVLSALTLTLPGRALATTLDATLFTLYNLITAAMLAVCALSSLPTTSGWNWNYLIYNPVPLLVWIASLRHPLTPRTCSRLYAGYALWAVAFMAAMALVGDHQIAAQYLLAATFAARCAFKAITFTKQQG